MNEQPWPTLHVGSTGDPVPALQFLLRQHGESLQADGIFGPITDAAVRAFQYSHGLVVDGIVGNKTWPALLFTVRIGSTGDAVRAVQEELNFGLHEMEQQAPELVVDGIFGSLTDQRVRAIQTICRITVDGIVGPRTWRALGTHEDRAWV